MSNAALADAHLDRRQHLRRAVQHSAELVRHEAHYDCIILDESDGGVLVEADQAMALPEEAVIVFSDSASQLVRRCWASANRAGYQFVQMVPVQRHWLQDDAQARQVDVLALNNFVAVSRTLLNLFAAAPNRLHSIEQICSVLLEMPRAQMQENDMGSAEKTPQLIAIPEAASGTMVNEQNWRHRAA